MNQQKEVQVAKRRARERIQRRDFVSKLCVMLTGTDDTVVLVTANLVLGQASSEVWPREAGL